MAHSSEMNAQTESTIAALRGATRPAPALAQGWLRVVLIRAFLSGGLVLATGACDPDPGDGDSGETNVDTGTTGDTTDDDPFDCGQLALTPALVTLGSGSTQFFELAGEPAPLKVIQGPQGGFHVWGSLRTQALHPGAKPGEIHQPPPSSRFVLALASGATVGDTGQIQRPLRLRSDGHIEMVGEVVPLFIGSIDEVVWQEATFSVEITDACGRMVTDTRHVTLEP